MTSDECPERDSQLAEQLSKIQCALLYGAQKEADELYQRFKLMLKERRTTYDLLREMDANL